MAGSDLKPICQPENPLAQVYAHRLCEKNTVVVFQICNVKTINVQ